MSVTARQLLEQMAALKDKLEGRLFNFERWLLEHGEAFDGGMVDRPDLMGEEKACYRNSANAVLFGAVDPGEWFYTEGVMALTAVPLAIDHAWLSNRQGQVLDLTSRWANNEGATYWGIPFDPRFLRRRIMEQEYYGLFSNGVHYQQITQQPLVDERAWPLTKEEAYHPACFAKEKATCDHPAKVHERATESDGLGAVNRKDSAQFQVGDFVVDRGGYSGSIVRVTEWRGSRWYDVRIMDGCRSPGVVVRYEDDLRRA